MRFNIEQEFKNYCDRVKLDTDNCPPVQVIETRRAFYAGVTSLLVFMRNDIAEQPEDDGVAALELVWSDLQRFWERQAGGGNRKL